MKKTIIGGIAVLLIAGGILTMVTASALYRRSQPAAESAGTSGNGRAYIQEEDWRKIDFIKEFSLTERSGRKFRSQELQGKVWVVSFFFSSCPASCKQQNEIVRQLHEKWGPRGVTFVSITCDPETDDAARLRQYAHTFGAHPDHWLFLTGELLHVRRIGGEVFGVYVDKGVHMDRLTLIDKWGKVRGHFDWHDPTKIDELSKSMEKLLAETEPPEEAEAITPSENKTDPEE
jgi:protein SCO1/2